MAFVNLMNHSKAFAQINETYLKTYRLSSKGTKNRLIFVVLSISIHALLIALYMSFIAKLLGFRKQMIHQIWEFSLQTFALTDSNQIHLLLVIVSWCKYTLTIKQSTENQTINSRSVVIIRLFFHRETLKSPLNTLFI